MPSYPLEIIRKDLKKKMRICAILIYIAVYIGYMTNVACHQVENDERYRLGKEKYEAIKRESKMPRYGKCWTDALTNLQNGCQTLTDDLQHRLALQYANCFLQKTGREIYPCELHQEVEECTKHMHSEAYNTYVEFFTHTQNICYFLQGQKWQQETEKTIYQLADSSHLVAEQIADSSDLQLEMMKQQNKTIKNQRILLEGGEHLRQKLTESAVGVHDMMTEFKKSTTEQRQLIFEVFDRVNSLQSMVMGEFTGFYSLIFYTVSILVTYLLTSTPRTSGARFWLFVLMTVNMVTERTVAMAKIDQYLDDTGQIIDENTILYQRLWVCRKIFTTAAIFVWGWVAWRYQDLIQLNNRLLVDIVKQNSELKQILKQQPGIVQTPTGNGLTITIGPEEKDIDPLPHTTSDRSGEKDIFLVPPRPSADNGIPHYRNLSEMTLPEPYDLANNDKNRFSMGTTTSVTSLENGISEKSCYASEDSDLDSDMSSISGRTDESYRVSDNEEESDAESFFTTDSWHRSREGTPAMMNELRDLRQATPLREMTPVPLNDSITSPNTSLNRRRGRPPGTKNKVYTPSPMTYNLRSRRGKVKECINPILETESPESFGMIVKQLMKTSMDNATKVNAMFSNTLSSTPTKLSKDIPAFFSSDEDE